VKRLRWVILVVVLALVAYPVWVGFQVWDQSRRDENHSADAIVVLGAAQYDGTPSPVFKARLDHAVYLYEQDFSDVVIVTGGKQKGDRFTEAEAGSNYLVDQGIPSEAIMQEEDGQSTLQSMRNVKELTEGGDIESLLLVSDPLHSERIKRIAHDLGFEESYASWASYQELNRSRMTKAKELVREVGAIFVYEFFDR
jgi:vancomycin permeability regulator SanA